jgi:hypothetical protein
MSLPFLKEPKKRLSLAKATENAEKKKIRFQVPSVRIQVLDPFFRLYLLCGLCGL